MTTARYIVVALAVMMTLLTASAASCRVQAPSQVPAGSAFTVEFILEGSDGSNLSLPKLEGAELLYGPSQSKSMSTTIINGHMSNSFSLVYTLYYQAVTPGRHTLGSASITADGKRLTTRPTTIEILPVGSAPSQQPAIPQQQSPTPAQSSPSNKMPTNGGIDPSVKDKDIFVRMTLSKDVVYEQEAVLCTIKIYSRINANLSWSCKQQPSFNDFLIEELPVNRNSQHTEVLNGQTYNTVEAKKYILFPQESGKLTISPGKYEASITYDPFDDFFGFGSSNPTSSSVINIPASPVTLDVRPLPSPKPANFSGAVGDFSVITRIKPNNNFKTYTPATYSIIVSGTGNLKGIQNPIINMPKEFDTYDPQSTVKMVPNDENARGSVTFDYLFIPQYEGSFKIPDSYFVFFNTETQQYDSIKVDGYNLNVGKGEGKPSEHYKLRSMDIRDIDKGDNALSKGQSFFITSPIYWIAALLALLAALGGIIAYKKMEKTRANTNLMRKRRASKLAQQRLKAAQARMLSNDRNGFYTETLTALWGYLSDKLSIPVSELSKDNIAAEMTNFGFTQQHIDDTMRMLETCEFAQYAPELEGGNMEQVYNESAALIDNLEKVKRNKAQSLNNTMRAITIITTLLFSFTAMAAGDSLVSQGNKAYESKQFDKAVELYERASKDGASSQLYYNLGNAYYRLNKREHAILNYERALKIDPANGDARYNLEFVREKSQLVDDNGANYFSSLLGNWVSHASSNTWAVIAFIAFLLTLAGVACYRIVDSIALQKLGFFGAIAMALITIIAVICSFYMHNRSTSKSQAIIMVNNAQIKKSPHDGDKNAAFKLSNGAKIEIIDSISNKGEKNKWYKIMTADEKSGWTQRDKFEII